MRRWYLRLGSEHLGSLDNLALGGERVSRCCAQEYRYIDLGIQHLKIFNYDLSDMSQYAKYLVNTQRITHTISSSDVKSRVPGTLLRLSNPTAVSSQSPLPKNLPQILL